MGDYGEIDITIFRQHRNATKNWNT